MGRRVALVFILLIAVCAHKAPPISKDRLSPRLLKVTVLNARQIQLSFSEDLDTAATVPDSMLITSAEETLGIILLYPSLSASEIVLITAPMSRIAYDIKGIVFDNAENKGSFKKTFHGSTSPDTIAPWLTGYAQGRNTNEFFLNFSEAMDTTYVAFSIVPKKEFTPVWVNSRYVSFIPETDSASLGFDTTYYLYLRKARDMSGNHTAAFITSITPDTVYKPTILTGKALIDETPVTEGLALLIRKEPVGIALVEKGEFAFDVRDSLAFTVQVITEDHTGTGMVRVGADNIIRLEKGKTDIDRFID